MSEIIKRPANKIDYHKQLIKSLDLMRSTGMRPKLLLHVCCAPCAAYPIQLLAKYFNIDVIFMNPNIYPIDELQKRHLALSQYLSRLYSSKRELARSVKILNNFEEYNASFRKTYTDQTSRFADEPEGGKRCEACFRARLEAVFQMAKLNKYEYVMTTLTSSRHKDAELINQIGLEIGERYPEVVYLASDFKKEDGELRSKEICEEYGVYRQDYCGCIYSLRRTLKN